MYQITSAADQLASKINGNSSASRLDKNSSSHATAAENGCGPQKEANKHFLPLTPLVIVQNERSLGTNLSQLNENENG